jgi:NitT/TauT family transport system substrate-binding protein
MGFRRLERKARAAACATLLVAVIAAAALPLGGCGGGRKVTRVVRMGYLRNDLHQLAYYVAREKGFFAEQGLDVREAGAFSAGPEEMSAFSAGELDMGYAGTAPIVTFTGQKMADVKVVAQANAVGSAIVVRNGLEANDVAALRGRVIAVPGYSTVQDFLLRTALKKAGMNDKDVNIIVVKPPEMIPALAAGQIDAAVAWEPYPSMVEAQQAGRVIISSAKIWPDHPCCMLAADSNFLKEHPDTVQRVVAAHVKATKYIRDNPLEAADMAHLFTGQPQAIAQAAMKNIVFDYKPDLKGIERYVQFLKSNGVIQVGDAGAFTRDLVYGAYLPGGGS